MSPLREARKYYGTYALKRAKVKAATSPLDARDAADEARKVLRYIVGQLELASWGGPKHKEKGVLANPFVDLSQWEGEEWKQNYRKGAPLIEARLTAAKAAKEATIIDPEGAEGYWAQYQANMIFAKAATTEINRFLEFESQAMAQLVRLDPTEARFHYLLADLHFQLDDQASWDHESQEAIRLDQISTDPNRKLKPSQRLQIQARRHPDNISIQYELAEALDREGDKDACKEVAEEVQRLDRVGKDPAKLTDSQRQQVQAWLKTG